MAKLLELIFIQILNISKLCIGKNFTATLYLNMILIIKDYGVKNDEKILDDTREHFCYGFS
jgi:hypothetical protein